MNITRIVDQVRTSRGNRQEAEKTLLEVEETTDEPQRSRLLLQALTFQNQAIAALEQALLATGD